MRARLIDIQFWLASFSVMVLSGTMMHAQNFVKVNTSITPLTNAKSQWVDFNNDDLLDLFTSGTTSNGSLKTTVYFNNGNDTFNSVDLVGLSDMAVDFGDYNKDGFIDIILSGVAADGGKRAFIYKNNTGIAFVAQASSFQGLSNGSVLWRDFDGDGDLDVLLTGLDISNHTKSLVYDFNTSGYTLIDANIENVSNGTATMFDANHDGLNELILTGLNPSGTPIFKVYTASKNLDFHPYASGNSGFAFNACASGNLDSDGFNDLIFSGLSGDTFDNATTLLINNKTNHFASTSPSTPQLASASINIIDLNNDGHSDFVLTGQDDTGAKHFHYFRNMVGNFTDVTLQIPNLYNGSISIADFDNDGDVDMFQIGSSDVSFQANIFKSNLSPGVPNAPPSSPTDLQSFAAGNSVELSWQPSTDDHTPQNIITYNLYISSDPSGNNLIISPLSNIETGFRKVPLEGNNGTLVSKIINGLPEGRYYWSVQAIDNSFSPSLFSVEQTFAICYDEDLGPDRAICFGTDVTFHAGSANDVVAWRLRGNSSLLSDSTTFKHHIQMNDTVVVEVIRNFGCTIRDTVNITCLPLPQVTLGADRKICFNGDLEISVAPEYDSVNWLHNHSMLKSNSHDLLKKIVDNDTIEVEVFNDFKCSNHDELIVNVQALPQFSIGPDLTICEGQVANVTISTEWSSTSWRTIASGKSASNVSTFQSQFFVDDTVIAEVYDEMGCKNSDSARVVILNLPLVDLGSDRSICSGENTLLEISTNGNQIKWLNTDSLVLGSGPRYTHTALKRDTIISTVIGTNNCFNSDTVVINVLPLPYFNIGRDTSVCYKQDLLLKTGANFSRVDWFSQNRDQMIVPGQWFYNHKVISDDRIIARVKDMHNCVAYDTISITMLPLPDFDIGSDREVCLKDSIELSIPGTWKQVNWFSAPDVLLGKGTSHLRLRVLESFSIVAQVLGLNGCLAMDTIVIMGLPLPSFELGDDFQSCEGDSIRISPGDVIGTYSWRVGEDKISSSRDLSLVPESSTRYSLTIINRDKCVAHDSVFVKVNSRPSFEITGSTEVCAGDSTVLKVEFGQWEKIQWYKGTEEIAENKTRVSALLLESSEIHAILTDTNACRSTRSFPVRINPKPFVYAGRDTLLCLGETVALGEQRQEGGVLSFEWTPAIGLSSNHVAQPFLTPTGSRRYIVSVLDLNGCTNADSVYVELNPALTIDAGADAQVCLGEKLKLGGNPTAFGSKFPYSYQWSSASSLQLPNVANPVVSPIYSEVYYLFVSSGRCSVVCDSVSVTVNPLPTIDAIPAYAIGPGESVTLTATGGRKYLWDNSETLNDPNSPNPIASPMRSLVYKVIGVDENGCRNEAFSEVIVKNNIFIPNLFTPNADGSNDVFRIFGSGIEFLKLSIFDLAGNQVFASDNLDVILGTGWDGTVMGKMVQSDTYVWSIDGKFYNGEPVTFQNKNRGLLRLMR